MGADLAVTRWHAKMPPQTGGGLSARSGTSTPENSGPPRINRLSNRQPLTKRSTLRAAPNSAAATATLSVTPKSPSRPKTILNSRRVTITNRGETRRTIEFTSYAEVVLAPAAADAAHPAFSNLFVQTQFARTPGAILCTRRPRLQPKNARRTCSPPALTIPGNRRRRNVF